MADVKCFVDGGGKAKIASQGVCDCWPRCFCCFGFPCGVGCWVSATVLGYCCTAVMAAGSLLHFNSRVLRGGKIPKEYRVSLVRVNETLGSGVGAVDFGISSEIAVPGGQGCCWARQGLDVFTSLPQDSNQRKLCTEMSNVNYPWWRCHVMWCDFLTYAEL